MNYKYVISQALALAGVINYAPRVVLQIVASLTDDSRGVIYGHKMFIVQATTYLSRLSVMKKQKFYNIGTRALDDKTF